MANYGLIVNVDKCINCHACFVACKEENKVAPGIQWNQLHRAENGRERIINYFRVGCMHCEDPACMKICPMKAIHKGPGGEVLVDGSKCIGCGMCAKACPWDVPRFNTSGRTNYFDKAPLAEAPVQPWQKRTPGKAERCTLCTHRTQQGLPPKCVEVCPTKSLVFVDYDKPTEEQAKLIARAVPLGGVTATKPKVLYAATHCDPAALKDRMREPDGPRS